MAVRDKDNAGAKPSASGKQPGGKPQDTDRLAQALRDNLHRRKAQARARQADRGKDRADSGNDKYEISQQSLKDTK